MENTNQETGQTSNQQSQQGAGHENRHSYQEEFKVTGDKVVSTVKELIREGNVRRLIIKNEEGKTLIEVPLTIGVVGTVLLPVWAALGALAALVANLTITVDRRGEPKTQEEVVTAPPSQA